MKFSATSVGDVAAFESLIYAVSSQLGSRPVVIVSAMTKVTDALLDAFDIARKGDHGVAFLSLSPHFDRHVEVAKHFLTTTRPNAFDGEMEFARGELSDLLMRVTRRSLPLALLKDAIVSYGEQLSSRLLTEVLREKGLAARHVDARRLIVTDDEYGAAQPIWEETKELVKLELEPLIAANEVPVMGGF